jgi:hypothetical protein
VVVQFTILRSLDRGRWNKYIQGVAIPILKTGYLP